MGKVIAPIDPQYSQNAMDELMGLMNPMSVGAPIMGFTKQQFLENVIPTLKEHTGSWLRYLRGNPAAKRIQELDSMLKSNEIVNHVESALDKINPQVYNRIPLQYEKYYPLGIDAEGTKLIYDPRGLFDLLTQGSTPLSPKALAQGISHETGHLAFRKPVRSFENVTWASVNNPRPSVNLNRFEDTFNKLEPTEMGDIFKMFSPDNPRSRIDYWKAGLNEGRLPQEEYFADAMGARAADVGGWEKFPINWDFFKGFFKE